MFKFKWVPATERRPDRDGDYLCVTTNSMMVLDYCKKLDAFNVWYSDIKDEAQTSTEIAVRAWLDGIDPDYVRIIHEELPPYKKYEEQEEEEEDVKDEQEEEEDEEA